MKKVLFIYLNAFSQTGGIQTFNKYFISGLEDISETDKTILPEIVSLYDKEKDIKSNLPFKTLLNSKLNAFKYIILNAKKFDTFIFGHVNFAPLAIVLYLLNSKSKIIFCTHGIEIWKKLPKTTEWIMNKSTVLTVSNFSMNELKKYNPNLKDVCLFPNCIKVKNLNEASNNPYDCKKFNILSVTRLTKSEQLKGIDTVIKAISLIKNNIPNIKYSVIGKGEDRIRLQKLAKELNVLKNIDFLGYVDDINVYYEHCDLFILPSKKEGFGIVYLEAMQYKKPIIAVNYGGPTDVIIDKKTGFMCEYNNINCLADKLIYLYKNKFTSIAMGEYGYKHLVENFTYKHFLNRLKKVLK